MKIGSLFSGYGGLDLAVDAVTGAETAWVSDIEPAACKVLAHHRPDVPNLGDISAVEWDRVEPVDILTGGFPCQDVSAAGKRGGLIRAAGQNRSGLWAEMARAINILRPSLVVAENVRGLLSAKTDAHPAVQPCAPCVDSAGGDESLGLRALGAVLGDLAELGYDAAWRVVRASDVGAPHQRARVFVVAWPADSDQDGLALIGGKHSGQRDADGRGGAREVRHDSESTALLPTPSRADGTGGPGNSGRAGGLNLRTAVNLLATPTTAIHTGGPPQDSRGKRDLRLDIADMSRWGRFAEAVARWEQLTRPAPEPTETGPRGGQRLSPAFVEWMMGLPDGHITDSALGLSRNEQLKLGGNGVVPQQAEFALRGLLADVAQAVAA